MEKIHCIIFLISILIVLSCSCETKSRNSELINVKNIKCLSVCMNYPYHQRYDVIPHEITELLSMINTLPTDCKVPIQDYENVSNGLSSHCCLHITLEQEDGDLQIINIHCITKDEGIIRIINHYSDDMQTDLALFEFKDEELVGQIQNAYLLIEDEINLS